MKFSPLRFACAAVASLAMVSSANAATILSFHEINAANTPIVASNPTASSTVLTTTGTGAQGATPPGWIPVFVTLLNAPTSSPAFMSFTTALASGTTATQNGSTISQGSYTGTIQFNSQAGGGGQNLLTVTFTGGLLSGIAGGNAASLTASTPASNVTFTSSNAAVQAALAAESGRNFAVGLSGLTSALAILNGTIAPFAASSSGSFSTSAAIPEPSSLVMAGIPALLGLGFVGYRRRSQAS